MSHGRQHRGKGRKQASAIQAQTAAYLDDLHRDDSAQARNWNNAPGQPYRRPRPPAVPRTPQRDGTRLVPVQGSSVEQVFTGEPGKTFFVQDTSGKITMFKIVRDQQ